MCAWVEDSVSVLCIFMMWLVTGHLRACVCTYTMVASLDCVCV